MAKLAQLQVGGYTINYPANFKFAGGTIGDILGAAMPYIFGFIGLIFLFVLISGGFDLLLSGGNPKKIESAQGKITTALIGLVIALAAYWIVQILETLFGLKITTP